MGLFDQILGAIENPEQEGSLGHLGDIVNTVEQLSQNTGTEPSTMQSILGIVGKYVRSSLQEKQATDGNEAAQATVDEYAGTSPSSEAVESLLSPFIQQEIGQVIQERTGLDAGMIQQFLPTLVPVVLNILKSGANSQNPQTGENPVLNAFLDADHSGSVNLADIMQMASRFLK
ncbi:MAG: hypothetical protein PUP93_32710 [Rhizonema sp. NSF051]|nr:hypothetical protein [Rhizonema sp. NSF051]